MSRNFMTKVPSSKYRESAGYSNAAWALRVCYPDLKYNEVVQIALNLPFLGSEEYIEAISQSYEFRLDIGTALLQFC